MSVAQFDYIVIGSGAGGGPLAAHLAKGGFKVMLLEAGGDPCADSKLGRWMYEVPIFHGLSTEYRECQWDYFVRHYASDERQAKDTKKVQVDGNDTVWYPRAGALGGCTAHNAMITVTPQDCDWDYIAELTGDDSWKADNMHSYFARLENCNYRARPGSLKYMLSGLQWSIYALFTGRKGWRDWRQGHGYEGWLTTSEADPRLVLKDWRIVIQLAKAIRHTLGIGNPWVSQFTRLDPNDLRNSLDARQGPAFTPLAVANGKRNGPREYLLRVKKEFPDNLTIQLYSLASRILFEGKRAVGVEFYEGKHLYDADPLARNGTNNEFTKREAFAAREVIVCAGAFNTPQLLKLSGVGPAEELKKFDIDVVVDLPGVGENLQDRYEVGVVTEFSNPYRLLEGATFAPPEDGGPPDPFFTEWETGKGIYASNGALLGILKRSSPDKQEPDLYIFGLPGYFVGYKPGYSAMFERGRNHFTWAVLKAYTKNNAGRVTLQSKDPRQQPLINFHYFAEGTDKSGADLDAVVEGVQFVRRLNKWLSAKEIAPGPDFEETAKLKEFIQNEAWGHHASCTCKIGPDNDPLAVLDSRFCVRGTEGLRIVDASVFPKIPGYFIVSAIYMISEKAADVIIEHARLSTQKGTISTK
jgi:choline dehydrogenase